MCVAPGAKLGRDGSKCWVPFTDHGGSTLGSERLEPPIDTPESLPALRAAREAPTTACGIPPITGHRSDDHSNGTGTEPARSLRVSSKRTHHPTPGDLLLGAEHLAPRVPDLPNIRIEVLGQDVVQDSLRSLLSRQHDGTPRVCRCRVGVVFEPGNCIETPSKNILRNLRGRFGSVDANSMWTKLPARGATIDESSGGTPPIKNLSR